MSPTAKLHVDRFVSLLVCFMPDITELIQQTSVHLKAAHVRM